ncbi:hypothetical protein BD626DRAFT_569428 [Schizophyllum amplum]|uniref:Uncharacterized protein n=1 Tax=Schizophyllum amplum TaxID=97359 RepID=A0A550CDI7_9AGAR|nr:hypothetical protein BD626DRAFT_569428 [Auriculariopsis ampla]
MLPIPTPPRASSQTAFPDGLIVAGNMSALFFGAQVVLYAFLACTLIKEGRLKSRVMLFTVATLLAALAFSSVVLGTLYAEGERAGLTRGSREDSFAAIDVAINVVARISLLATQVIIVWRAWILWSTNVGVRIALSLLVFASCATTVVSMGLCFVAVFSTSDVPGGALAMLVPLLVINTACVVATGMRVWSDQKERILDRPHAVPHWHRTAHLAVFFIDSGALLGAFLVLFLAADVATGDTGVSEASNSSGSVVRLYRTVVGAASGVAGIYGTMILMLVARRASTADILVDDDMRYAPDGHPLASSASCEKDDKWKPEKDAWIRNKSIWGRGEKTSSDRDTISTVDELPRYSRHMRDAKAFFGMDHSTGDDKRTQGERPISRQGAKSPVEDRPGSTHDHQVPPPSWDNPSHRSRLPLRQPTRPLHVERSSGDPHSTMRTSEQESSPGRDQRTKLAPSSERQTADVMSSGAEQNIVEVSANASNDSLFSGWRIDAPMSLRPLLVPPAPRSPASRTPTSSSSTRTAQSTARSSRSRTSAAPSSSRTANSVKRLSPPYGSLYAASPLYSIRELPPPPPPESEADAFESTYVHAPESTYTLAPESIAPSPQSSAESIVEPPNAWRWPGPNPSSRTPYPYYDNTPYRNNALSRSAVSNLSSPSTYSVDSMALAIRDAADPLELYGNYVWGLKVAAGEEREEVQRRDNSAAERRDSALRVGRSHEPRHDKGP